MHLHPKALTYGLVDSQRLDKGITSVT